MEFTINRNVLLDNLSKANKIVDYKTYNPVLMGILIDVKDEKIVIKSTNNSLSFKSILSSENSGLKITTPGQVLIKGKYVLEMLRRLEDKNVTLITVETNELTIKTEKIEFNCGILDSSDYPLIGFKERGNEVFLNSLKFKKILSQTITSIDENNKKIILTGMNFRINKQIMYISTTDMHRISQKTMKLDLKTTLNINVTIPYKTVVELMRLLDNTNNNFKMIVSDGYLTFVIDDIFFQTNLIDGQYPVVEGVFPKDFNLSLLVNQRSFLKALHRADFANESGTSPIINLDIQKERIVLKSDLFEIGNLEEEFIDFTSNTDFPLTINFNSKYLIDALKTFESEEIELHFISSTKPLLINQKNDDSLKQVILPTQS